MTPTRSGPDSGSLPCCAISRIVLVCSSTRCASSTICSPTGVTATSTLPRSKSCTPSSSSSFLIATDSVGWLTKQASAARPKWRSRATATMYFSSVSVIGMDDSKAGIAPPAAGARRRATPGRRARSGILDPWTRARRSGWTGVRVRCAPTVRRPRAACSNGASARLRRPVDPRRPVSWPFESTCAQWLRDAPGLPVLACGMIGSRQGWREAPYLPTPAGFDELAGGRRAHRRCSPDAASRSCPGVRTENGGGTHDVMRGRKHRCSAPSRRDPWRETHGRRRALVARRRRVLFVLPGTHSKWVRVREGRIRSFRTYLTGELFAVLSAHSILGRLFRKRVRGPPRRRDRRGTGAGTRAERAQHGDDADRAGFDLGVRRAADPAGLTALLFSVRSEGLFAALAPEALPAYLSGLLIGTEIAHAAAASRRRKARRRWSPSSAATSSCGAIDRPRARRPRRDTGARRPGGRRAVRAGARRGPGPLIDTRSRG